MQFFIENKLTSARGALFENLKRIFLLRVVIIVFLILSLIGLRYLNIPLPLHSILLALFLMALLNGWTYSKLNRGTPLSDKTILSQLVLDVCVLTFMFYFIGGYGNPFIWMYLIPITIGAVSLKKSYLWFLTSVSFVSYTALIFFNRPISHLHMHEFEFKYDIHSLGMWLGFIVSAAVITIFVSRIGQNLRDQDRLIANAREKVLESERMLALGAVSTSTAHELGTPLATMAVITKDFEHLLAKDKNALKKLSILTSQIKRCKEILATLSSASQDIRQKKMAKITINQFISEVVDRWRDTRLSTQLSFKKTYLNKNLKINYDRALSQAIQNLLDNAADASEDKVDFSIETNKQYLSLIIRDYGNGNATYLNQSMYQPQTSSKGLGLGVYLSKTIFDLYEGSFEFNAHSNRGIIATVKIPIKRLIDLKK
jgi:two-component system sensor histidine kinase RegB